MDGSLQVRSARALAENFYGAELRVDYFETTKTTGTTLLQLLPADPARIRFEIIAQASAADIPLSHQQNIVNGANGRVISANDAYMEDWKDHIVSVGLPVWTLTTTSTTVLIRTWTLKA